MELEEEEGHLLRSPGRPGGKTGRERHRLYDLNGAMPPKERPVAASARANGDRSKERSSPNGDRFKERSSPNGDRSKELSFPNGDRSKERSSPTAGKEGSRKEGRNKQTSPAGKADVDRGRSVAATTAVVEEIDALVAERIAERIRSMRPVDVDLAAADRTTPKKPANTSKSSPPPPPRPPITTASNHDNHDDDDEKPATKKGGDGGAGRPKDKDRGAVTVTPTKRYRILSSNHLPPGWEIIRIGQPDKHVSFVDGRCRWA